MKAKFYDVFIISEKIERKSTEEFFWPNEVRKFKRQKLIDQNKREGWICRFLNGGLLLEADIIISKNDYKDWPENHITPNPNITKSELNFHANFEINIANPVLHFTHAAQDAEAIRKKIYISQRFGAEAHHITAAQYFENPQNKAVMNFVLGFERSQSSSDKKVIESILSDLKMFDHIELI